VFGWGPDAFDRLGLDELTAWHRRAVDRFELIRPQRFM
jgi:hypothetical protein